MMVSGPLRCRYIGPFPNPPASVPTSAESRPERAPSIAAGRRPMGRSTLFSSCPRGPGDAENNGENHGENPRENDECFLEGTGGRAAGRWRTCPVGNRPGAPGELRGVASAAVHHVGIQDPASCVGSSAGPAQLSRSHRRHVGVPAAALRTAVGALAAAARTARGTALRCLLHVRVACPPEVAILRRRKLVDGQSRRCPLAPEGVARCRAWSSRGPTGGLRSDGVPQGVGARVSRSRWRWGGRCVRAGAALGARTAALLR